MIANDATVKVDREALQAFEEWWETNKSGGGEWIKRSCFVAGFDAARASISTVEREALESVIRAAVASDVNRGSMLGQAILSARAILALQSPPAKTG